MTNQFFYVLQVGAFSWENRRVGSSEFRLNKIGYSASLIEEHERRPSRSRRGLGFSPCFRPYLYLGNIYNTSGFAPQERHYSPPHPAEIRDHLPTADRCWTELGFGNPFLLAPPSLSLLRVRRPFGIFAHCLLQFSQHRGQFFVICSDHLRAEPPNAIFHTLQ